MYLVGARVVRGPDWLWDDQDGGLGSVGTVVELGEPGSKRTPDNTVVVCWDCGLRSNYRTGYQGQYDLTMVDNAQCGITHTNLMCDSCKQNQILGMRYKCTICNDYDLCFLCYHSDIHNLDHPFLRFDYHIARGVKLTPRSKETKIVLRGIYPGALVQRGNDWSWGNQDGGSTGIVTDIICWGNESSRSVARVKWKDGTKNDYRVGHNGIMDLKFETPALGGNCYRSHCPIYGKTPDESLCTSPQDGKKRVDEATGGMPRLYPGDRVRVALDADTLRHLQQGHGGWNPRMADYIGKVGIVHRVTERGDIRVQHDGCPNRWTFHPAALVAVVWYRKGDIVRLTTSATQARQLQRLHGEWVPAMENALGKTARVIQVYSDGDLRIQILEDESKQMWTMNPECVTLVQRYPVADQPDVSNPPEQQVGQSSSSKPPPASPIVDRPEMRLLMSKVALGDLEYVKGLYETDQSIIDTPYCGKTLLQVAAYQGHRPLVQFLLSKGARPNAVDDDGDSVLHDAAFGNQPEILQILLAEKDVDINAVNRSSCTALHIAAHKCLPHCVWVLLLHKPNVNLQDTYGDTALHDAINNQCANNNSVTQAAAAAAASQSTSSSSPSMLTGSMKIIQMLCDYPDTNCALANKRGFNALQHAALKGNSFACTAICRRYPDLVDRRKDDGFSALHLASLNGHADAVNALVTMGRADLNLKNNREQTPLLLSISQGHCVVLEQLVNLGCDVKAKDEDDNTALHIAFMKRTNAQSSEVQKPNQKDCPQISALYEGFNTPSNGVNVVTYAISVFLMLKGCDPNIKNKEGKTVYDLMSSDPNGIKLFKALEHGGVRDPLIDTFFTSRAVDSSGDQSERIVHSSSSGTSGATASSNETDVADVRSLIGVGSPIPNGNREGSYSAANVGINVNASPSKRNNYNLVNYADLGECSSSNSSPMHFTSIMNRNMMKANNIPSPAHPVRPSRMKKSNSPPPDNTGAASRGKPAECVVCCELSEVNCLLEPCGHRPACEDCTARMKKCLSCGTIIERRLTVDGRSIPCRSRQPSAERLRYLECKIQEIEEAHCCPICMERRRTVAFLCGHGACAKCAATLTTCHMCRQDITSKINLY
ncbi:E3 ubiquitin-protein ligase mind bomb 2 isoform X2 [Arctopsyche grandis]|uniref:E3 ubiquitin-protein ligase mind bomb 2 isoform X2 n=1 Tax=Arctopsyche grandis TaxID=121162 RepID=UPI00406D6892